MRKLAAIAIAVVLGAVGTVTRAADLRIALGAEITSADPHYHSFFPNNNLGSHVFDPLIRQDHQQRLVPALAVSWKAIDERIWEFELRQGVKFHNGAEFTAEDVKFTLERVPNVPNSPASFRQYMGPIKTIEIVSPHRVRFHTEYPHPILPEDISSILIVSKGSAGATTDDYNAGRAAIGTGPFKFVQWARGERVELARNPDYWGEKAAWDRVTFRLITSNAIRLAALLAGDVDAIENVPTDEVERLKKNAALRVESTGSSRVIFLPIDSGRDRSPHVTDKAGNPLDRNPLKDVRVRRAISKAINRQALVDRIMDGQAIPAGQIVPEGFFGYDPAIKIEAFDPEGARTLLREAGYAEGFGITLHSPNNRYVNDDKLAQAIGAMLTRVGIQTKVEALPSNIFFPRWGRLEHSIQLVGWGSGSGEAAASLRTQVATYDRDSGWGASNVGRYSNPTFDALLRQVFATIDRPARERLLQQASALSITDQAFIPLHFQVNIWAMKRDVTYKARSDEYTLAQEFRPAK